MADFNIIQSSNPGIAIHPQRLMRAARKLDASFLSGSQGCDVISTLNYPLLWGLGSSSTLIAAVAGWAKIDPFMLHFEVSKGSGYDIACALSEGPILYLIENNIPSYERVVFSPSFSDKLFFVYQGIKQDSAEGIIKFRNRISTPDPEVVNTASLLTRRMLHASSVAEFEQVMREHEVLVSAIIGVSSIKETVFTDLPGEVKSLGAWGGDFCMLTWNEDPALLAHYLKSKGLETWFNFSDIVL
jgi:mevalonate kinase